MKITIRKTRAAHRAPWFAWHPKCSVSDILPQGEFTAWASDSFEGVRAWTVRHMRIHERLGR